MLTAFPKILHVPAWGQAACATLSSPALTEGPYFVDEDLNRTDIREDPSDNSVQAGVPLLLAINVSKLVDCQTKPLTGAYVDIWHCNVNGTYSDVSANRSAGQKYLRGWQATNRQGNVYFTTIYPGWYQGRAVHIHVKVRMMDGLDQTYEFTSQFFFKDEFTAEVYQRAPYNARPNPDTLVTTDGIARGGSSIGSITSDSGSYLMLDLRDKGEWIEGEAKLICDLTLGSSPDQAGGGMGGPGGPVGPGGA
ncbi:MAG: hypothetical protein HY820_23785 [Acidobacteria bacterium]|nr:hypothetical protein [Acidobacteriota bacterium]